MRMLLPKRVSKGAKFGFFSPSEPIYPRRIEFIIKAIDIIHGWGFRTEEITKQMFQEWSVLRNPSVRADEFHCKLLSTEYDVLIAAWGGKNSNDLLELLDYDLIRKVNKPIVGSSDIAVLLNAITEKSRIVTYYGPNVLGKFNQTEEIGMPLLLDKFYKTNNLFPKNCESKIKIIRHGKCKGRLVGGSLGTFTLGLSGSEFMPKFRETIFFFESSSLDYFKIRQHLQNLRTTGFLKNVVALIVGVTSQIKDDEIASFEAMLIELFTANIPILTTELFGHGFYFNPTFPIGSIVNIDTKTYSFNIDTELQ